MQTLFVKSGTRYRSATASEVCESATAYLFQAAEAARPNLSSPKSSRDFLRAQGGIAFEQFGALYLDNRHRLIKCEILFNGTIDGASVHPREVVRRALEENAAAVILFHNHPSGVAEPSHADEMITTRLKGALALIDVRVLDHLIVTAGATVSFAERGLI